MHRQLCTLNESNNMYLVRLLVCLCRNGNEKKNTKRIKASTQLSPNCRIEKITHWSDEIDSSRKTVQRGKPLKWNRVLFNKELQLAQTHLRKAFCSSVDKNHDFPLECGPFSDFPRMWVEIRSNIMNLNLIDVREYTYLVCTQSIGFPTYCRVVTAIENVTSKMTVAFVCKRNTAESVFTWFACTTEKKTNGKKRFVYAIDPVKLFD